LLEAEKKLAMKERREREIEEMAQLEASLLERLQ
jgi:hypothetical protein